MIRELKLSRKTPQYDTHACIGSLTSLSIATHFFALSYDVLQVFLIPDNKNDTTEQVELPNRMGFNVSYPVSEANIAFSSRTEAPDIDCSFARKCYCL